VRTLGLLLLAAGAAQGELPERVFLKSPGQSFSYENDYALKDGKLWLRPRAADGSPAGAWALFEGTGVPSGSKAPSFATGDSVASFATEGLMVVAASNRGRLYAWQPTLFGPTVWLDQLGQPLAGPLVLPPHRDWTFSMSVQVAPKKRRTPMHDIDAFYEDAAGNRIEFGFTATVYLLDPDGQHIRYWDTGLPPAFYKAFATPERGRFVAERLSASGSTIFVVDAAGRTFTRMMDYEMGGACPGLRYTFEHKRQSAGNAIIPLFEAWRVLPVEDWRQQPAIPLSGAAEQTSRISIHLTGQGNAARELRVQGRDAGGASGYWWKPIDAQEWHFQETGEVYAPAAKLARTVPPQGRAVDKGYVGTLTQPSAPDVSAELVDFDYYDSPTTLRLHSGARTFDVLLHTFDAWGPTVEQKEQPALVGSVLGEPKLLVGTLEVPAALLEATEPDLRAFVDTYLRRFHHVHQAFAISADDGRVEIHSKRAQRSGLGPLDYALRKPIDLVLSRAVSAEEMARYEDIDFRHLVQSPALLLPDDAANDLSKIDEALRRNRTLLGQIQKQAREQRLSHLEEGAVSALASAAFVPVNALSDALGLPERNALAGGIALGGGNLLKQYAAMNLKRVISSPEDSKEASAELERRIRAYEALRKKQGGR
jgi:hypothetical protein